MHKYIAIDGKKRKFRGNVLSLFNSTMNKRIQKLPQVEAKDGKSFFPVLYINMKALFQHRRI